MIVDFSCQPMLKKIHEEYEKMTHEENSQYFARIKILQSRLFHNNITSFEKYELGQIHKIFNKIREYLYKKYISSSATFLFDTPVEYDTMSQYHRHLVFFYMTNENINKSQNPVIIRENWNNFLSDQNKNDKNGFILVDIHI